MTVWKRISIAILGAVMASLAGAQTKPPVLPVWAATATPTSDILQPSNGYISQGWPLSSTPPSRQTFNWLENYTFNGIRYLSHRGITDWDTAETYSAGDLTYGPDTYIYKSRTNGNTGNSPVNIGIPTTNWDVPAVPTAPNGDNSVRIANTTWIHANFIPQGSGFSSIAGQIGTGQVPLGAVQQFQGSLSIGFGQLTGVPTSASAVPNTIALRDGSGNLGAVYLDQTSSANENPAISQVAVTGSDNTYWRKAGFGNLQNQINIANLGGSVGPAQIQQSAVTQFSPAIFAYNPLVSKAQTGCSELPGGIILMWGLANPNGGSISVAFPCGGFPNAVFSIVSNSTAVPTQSNVTSWSKASFVMSNTGGQSFWMATGD